MAEFASGSEFAFSPLDLGGGMQTEGTVVAAATALRNARPGGGAVEVEAGEIRHARLSEGEASGQSGDGDGQRWAGVAGRRLGVVEGQAKAPGV